MSVRLQQTEHFGMIRNACTVTSNPRCIFNLQLKTPEIFSRYSLKPLLSIAAGAVLLFVALTERPWFSKYKPFLKYKPGNILALAYILVELTLAYILRVACTWRNDVVEKSEKKFCPPIFAFWPLCDGFRGRLAWKEVCYSKCLLCNARGRLVHDVKYPTSRKSIGLFACTNNIHQMRKWLDNI